MPSLIRLLALTLLLCHVLPATAGDSVNQGALDAQKELLQLKIDSNRELLQKDIEKRNDRIDTIEKKVEAQNNRIGDIGQSIDRTGLLLSLGGTLITILLFLGGLVSYFTVTRKAMDEARVASKKWFSNNQEKLSIQILNLERKVDDAESRINQLVGQVTDKRDESLKEMDAAMEKIQSNINSKQSHGQTISEAENDALRQNAEYLREKPEARYSFEDWNARAFEAYNSERYEEAVFYWKNASAVPDASVSDVVMALSNRANTLAVHIKQDEEAVSIYREIIKAYSSVSASSVRSQIAYAMCCLASTLDGLGRVEEAIATYEQVVDIYSNDRSRSIQNIVADAMNGLGFVKLILAKNEWENKQPPLDRLFQAKTDLENSLKRKPGNGMALGNIAYIEWLLGDKQASEQSYRSALNALEFNGEELYKATQDDIAQYPIPEDQGFKEMVDRLWAEYQAANPPPAPAA